jgi:hypothetical protein
MEVDLISAVWFLAGGLTGLLLFEVVAILFYCLPRTTTSLFRKTSSLGLLWFYLRGLLLRSIGLAFLWVCFERWGFLHDRAVASGMSIIAAFYLFDFFALGGKARLSAVFLTHAARYRSRGDVSRT